MMRRRRTSNGSRSAVLLVILGLAIAAAFSGAAASQPGQYTIGAGGDLDWLPTSGAFGPLSSSDATSRSGTLTGPDGAAAYSVAAGPGIARGSLAGSFTGSGRFDPTLQASGATELTLVGPTGYVATPVSVNLHVDSTLSITHCAGSCMISIGITGHGGTTRLSTGSGFSENGLGLTADPIAGGYHVHGDVTTPVFGMTPNLPTLVNLGLSISVASAGASDFTAGTSTVSYATGGPVINGVPAGYTVSGPGVADNRWTDPFAPPPPPTFTATPTTGTAGTQIDVQSVDPCPGFDDVFFYLLDSDSSGIVPDASFSPGSLDVDGSGAWSGTVTLDPGSHHGPARLAASCGPPGNPRLVYEAIPFDVTGSVFTATPTSGPAGTPIDVQSVDPCPGYDKVFFYLFEDDGTGIPDASFSPVSLDVDGSGAWSGTVAIDPGSHLRGPARLAASCGAPGGPRIRYEPIPFAVTGSIFTATPTTGTAGTQIDVQSVDPCPGFDDVQFLLLDGNSNSVLQGVSFTPSTLDVDASGAWSGTVTLDPGQYRGPARLVAVCGSLGGPRLNYEPIPFAVTGSIFTATPTTGTAGTQIDVQSVDPCPGFDDVQFLLLDGNSNSVLQGVSFTPSTLDVDASGAWSGTVTLDPGQYRGPARLVAVCGSLGGPRLNYEPIPFTVTAPPVARLAVAPASPSCGQQVGFDGSASTAAAGAQLVKYRWDFDDGGGVLVTTQPTTQHTYASFGIYHPTLVVQDDQGNARYADQATVSERDNGVPTAVLSAPSTIANDQSRHLRRHWLERPGSGLRQPPRQVDLADRQQLARPDHDSDGQQQPPSPASSTPGLHTLTLTVQDDSANESAPASQQLTVDEPQPDIELRYDDGAPMPADSTALENLAIVELGTVDSGSTATLNFRVANVGDATLHFAGLSKGGVPAGGIGSVQLSLADIVAGQDRVGVFTCGGTNTGNVARTINFVVAFYTDDPDEASLFVHVQCSILPEPQPDIELRYDDGAPMPADSTALENLAIVELGTVDSGSTATLNFRVANVGDATLHFAGLSKGGVPAGGIGSVQLSLADIGAGQDRVGVFTCGGTNTGNVARTINFVVAFYTDDPDEASLFVHVQCSILPEPDATAPTITATATPVKNANGWNNTDVTVSYTCTDSGSGVNQVASSLGNDVLTASGTATGTCVDNAGNSVSASYTAQIDKVGPTVSYAGNTGTYGLLEHGRHHLYRFRRAVRGGSSTCANASGPAWTFGAGSHTLSANATDRAGNTGVGLDDLHGQCHAWRAVQSHKAVRAGLGEVSGAEAGQKAAVDALVTVTCNFLLNIGPTTAPALKTQFINAYKAAITALVAPGWLTANQAATLKTLANAI